MTEAASGVPANRMVKFGEAFSLGLKNYAQFYGRSSRGAYWWWTLWMILISFGLGIVDMIVFSSFVTAHDMGPLGAIFSLATLIPGIAIGVRRLHDVGHSGWWLLIVFTIIGILLILWWAVQPGERKENRFGADAEAGR